MSYASCICIYGKPPLQESIFLTQVSICSIEIRSLSGLKLLFERLSVPDLLAFIIIQRWIEQEVSNGLPNPCDPDRGLAALIYQMLASGEEGLYKRFFFFFFRNCLLDLLQVDKRTS